MGINALDLIHALRTHIQESTSPCFASRDDCEYFRAAFRAQQRLPEPTVQVLPPPPPQPKIVEQQPFPTPAAEPPKPPAVTKEPRLQPLPPLALEDSFDDVRKILSKCAPQLAIFKEIPSDAPAQKIASRWKTKNQGAPFSLLSFHESPSHQKLLTNLTTAIDVIYGGSRLISAEGIEQAKQWEAFLSVADLKLIIVCDSTLWQMPHLLQFYRELPNRSERFLLNTPVFLLPDLTLYLKDPLLKRSLWKALCQKIA